VLILTRSPAIRHLTNVTVAPLTRTIRLIQSEVVISPADGVPELCAANLDNILTIPITMLEQRIGRISTQTMEEAKQTLRYVFAL
jgi:mRNA interferase MazF